MLSLMYAEALYGGGWEVLWTPQGFMILVFF